MPTLTSFIRFQFTNLAFIALLAASPAIAAPQFPDVPAQRDQEEEKRLPNGKLQSEAILKADYKANLKDLEKLRKTAEAVEEDLRKNQGRVLSLKAMKDLEEVEKIARRIRGRMKRF